MARAGRREGGSGGARCSGARQRRTAEPGDAAEDSVRGPGAGRRRGRRGSARRDCAGVARCVGQGFQGAVYLPASRRLTCSIIGCNGMAEHARRRLCPVCVSAVSADDSSERRQLLIETEIQQARFQVHETIVRTEPQELLSGGSGTTSFVLCNCSDLCTPLFVRRLRMALFTFTRPYSVIIFIDAARLK